MKNVSSLPESNIAIGKQPLEQTALAMLYGAGLPILGLASCLWQGVWGSMEKGVKLIRFGIFSK